MIWASRLPCRPTRPAALTSKRWTIVSGRWRWGSAFLECTVVRACERSKVTLGTRRWVFLRWWWVSSFNFHLLLYFLIARTPSPAHFYFNEQLSVGRRKSELRIQVCVTNRLCSCKPLVGDESAQDDSGETLLKLFSITLCAENEDVDSVEI